MSDEERGVMNQHGDPSTGALDRQSPDEAMLRHEAASIDFGRLGSSLRRRWPIVVVLALAGAIAGYAIEAANADVYEATAALLVQPTVAETELELSARAADDAERDVATEAAILDSNRVRQVVSDEFGSEVSYRVEVADGTDIIEITTQAPQADEAAAAADGVIDIYLADRAIQRSAELTAATASLEAIVEDLDDRVALADRRVDGDPDNVALLADRDFALEELADARAALESLRRQTLAQDTGARLVASADPPDHPIAPNPARAGLLAGIAGTVIGLALVWLRQRRTLGSPDDASVTITRWPASTTRGSDNGLPSFLVPAEENAADVVQGAVVFDLLAKQLSAGPRAVLFAGVGSSERTAAIAARVSRTMAAKGLRTALVAADLHDPTIDIVFSLSGRPGLADVAHGTPVDDLLHIAADEPQLGVLPRGTHPTEAGAVASRATAKLLAHVRDIAHMTVIAGPPVTGGTDAQFLAAETGATMLVAPMGCSMDVIIGAGRSVERAGGHLVGIILDGQNVEHPSPRGGTKILSEGPR